MTKAANKQLRFLPVFIRAAIFIRGRYTHLCHHAPQPKDGYIQHISVARCTIYDTNSTLNFQHTTHRLYALASTCAAELGEKPADGRNFPHHLPGHLPQYYYQMLLPNIPTTIHHYPTLSGAYPMYQPLPTWTIPSNTNQYTQYYQILLPNVHTTFNHISRDHTLPNIYPPSLVIIQRCYRIKPRL